MVWSRDLRIHENPTKWANTKNFRHARLADGTRLEDVVDNWEEILDFRDEHSSRDFAFMFVLGTIRFSLDVLEGRELEMFEEEHIKPFDPDFMRHGETRFIRDDDCVMNIIFFRPKEGKYKGMVFRLTVGNYKGEGANTACDVVSGFFRILLAGDDHFSDLIYYRSRCPWGNFPRRVPIAELLPRADNHEFIRIDFDPISLVGVASVMASNVKTMSFVDCEFPDNGDSLMGFLATHKLDSLQWEGHSHQTTLVLPDLSQYRNVFPFKKRAPIAGIKSLTLSFMDLANDAGLSQFYGHPCVVELLVGIEHLRIIDRFDNRTLTTEEWTRILDARIRHHPTLKTLEIVATDMDAPIHLCEQFLVTPKLKEAMIQMVKQRENTPLQSVQLCAIHFAITRPEFCFALLNQNADVLKNN